MLLTLLHTQHNAEDPHKDYQVSRTKAFKDKGIALPKLSLLCRWCTALRR